MPKDAILANKTFGLVCDSAWQYHYANINSCTLSHTTNVTLQDNQLYITKLQDKRNETRGQSNLAKAASNASHKLHMQDSVALAAAETWRSQNSKIG